MCSSNIKNLFLFNTLTDNCEWHENYENENITIIGEINIKKNLNKKVLIGILGSIDEPYYIKKKSKWNNIGFLKSHLQKCVRRMLPDLAVKTAVEIMKINLKELLRRLPIIIIEDVCLVNIFPKVVWLMCANSKGYELSKNDLKWLLGVIYAISDCKTRHLISNQYNKKFNVNKINLDVYNISILMRIAYGGMNCDMNMLENACLFKKKEINLDVKRISFKKKKLKLKEIIPYGIDFHIKCNILDEIKKLMNSKKLFINTNMIRKWVWDYRSSINNRLNLKEERDSPLKSFHREVDNICLLLAKNKFYEKN
jgi:hypothetical protein